MVREKCAQTFKEIVCFVIMVIRDCALWLEENFQRAVHFDAYRTWWIMMVMMYSDCKVLILDSMVKEV